MPKPLKLLSRSWLQGKGCVHQRSAAMSEAEARELLEVGRGAIEKAQESGGIEQIPLAKGRAYVKARRAPDPDEPRRTAPGFVLVSIPDPEAFIREVVAREFDELLRSAAEMALDQTEAPGERELGQRGWRIIDLGGPPHVSTTRARSRAGTGRIAIAGGILAIVALAGLFLFNLPIWDESPIRDGQARSQSGRADTGSDPKNADWREARGQIERVLASVDGEAPGEETDRDLLRRFALLFQRPDLEATLNENDLKWFKNQSPSDHPFVAFLSRLPATMSRLEDGEGKLTPTQAMSYLEEIDGNLKECTPYPIHIDLETPRTLADQAKISLSYPDFYETWLKKISPAHPSRDNWKKNEPWDESRSYDVAYLWVKPIRSLIKDRYSRR